MKRVGTGVSVCALLTAVGSVALAQESSGSLAAPAVASSPSTLQEVVVTAQRRVENLQHVPIAITAIPGSVIRSEGKVSLNDVLVDAPSVQVQNSPQGGQIYIRGLGSNGDSDFLDPTVSLYKDGIYTNRAESVFGAVYDIDRVEVLRGPQGTLYGRNATGGAVNILTASPTSTYEGDVNVDLGNYALRHEDGAVNLPLTDTFAVRIAALREDRNGYYSNGGDSSHETGYRIKARWNITPSLTVTGLIDYLHQTGLGVTSTATPGGSGPFDWDQRKDNPWYVDASHPANKDNYRFITYGANIEWNLGWGVITVLPAYSQSSRYYYGNLVAGTFGGSALTAVNYNENQTSVEARIASPASSPIKWVGGIYYLHDPQTESGTASGNATYYDQTYPTVGTDSIAGFAQATYPVTDNFRLTGGIRYTHDKRTESYEYTTTTIAGYTTSGSAQDSYSAFTYKVGAEYDLTPQNLLYTTISTAYKAGGFDTTSEPPLAYQPEHLTAYEIGSKNRFISNTLQVNAEAFYYQYHGYQVQYATCQTSPIPTAYIPTDYVDSTCGTNATVFAQEVLNAGPSTVAGMDGEVRWQFTRDDEFDVSATYLDTRYGELVLPGAGVSTPPGGGTSDDLDLTGTSIIQSPKWSGLVGYQHQIRLGSLGSLTARLQSKLSTGYFVNTKKDMPGAYQDGYSRSDAFLTYTTADSRYSVAFWIKNIENNAQTTNVLPLYRRLITDPETFGLNLSARFK